MSNKQSYLRSIILYFKWKYGVHITQNILTLYTKKCQPNAKLVSLICLLNELTDTRDDFKVIPNFTQDKDCRATGRDSPNRHLLLVVAHHCLLSLLSCAHSPSAMKMTTYFSSNKL